MKLNAERVKYLMQVNFLNAGLLAKDIGISRQSVYRLLRGETQPKPDTLKRICNALDCEAADILEAEDNG